MKALISPNEVINNFDNTNGYRVAEVSPQGFEVALPLFWVDCEDNVAADQFYYDPIDSQIKAVPIPPAPEPAVSNVIGDAPDVIA
jgi:hypothetical protein